MSRTASNQIALPTIASLPPVSRLLVSAALLLARWEDRRRSRIALQRLNDQQLKDIGLTGGTVSAEIAKPFWRA